MLHILVALPPLLLQVHKPPRLPRLLSCCYCVFRNAEIIRKRNNDRFIRLLALSVLSALLALIELNRNCVFCVVRQSYATLRLLDCHPHVVPHPFVVV